MKKAFQFVYFAVVATGMAGFASACMAADTAPPRELVQFVHEAKKRGLKDDKIKQQAISVGWPAATIEAAIEYDKTGKLPPETISGGVSASGLKSRADSVSYQPPAVEARPVVPEAKPSVSERTATFEFAPPGPEGGGSGTRPGTSSAQDYEISTGDTLQVSVWKQPELTVPNEIVRPDGKITVPLIKEVEVAGLTPRQVESAITARLVEFITDPNVTVVVTGMSPKNVYVTGGVKKEGPVPYTSGMTVLQAIGEAGGLNDYAKRKKIYVLHTENGREYRSDFNYDEVVRGLRMEQNITLLPNDTVVIPH